MGETSLAAVVPELARASTIVSLDGFARLAALGEKQHFVTGTVLMKQGEDAQTMYVILSGRVSVVREHAALATPIVLAQLGAGEIVGEMGLLDSEPRSATVTALEDTIAMEVPASALADCVASYPEVYSSLLKVLTKRLRSTDELATEIARRSP